MLSGVKQIVKWVVTSTPGLSSLYHGYWLSRRKLDEKQLRGMLQLAAHSMDLLLVEGRRVPRARIRELQYLLAMVSRREIPVDGPIAWAANVLVMARYGLRPEVDLPKEGTQAPGREGALPDIPLRKALMERRSVRKWTAEPVSLDDVCACIEMARWAPSSCNRQLWQALVIQDPEEKDFLKHTFPNTFYAKAPVVIVVVMKTGNYGLDERHFVYLDGGAFIQNLLLALHAKGYGACWVGFRAWDASGNVYFPRERYEEFHERFKLEKDQVPISLIAVGRPAVAPVPPPRQGLEQILIKQGAYREPRS